MSDTDTGTSTQDGQNDTGGTTSTAGGEPKTITMTSQQLAERLARAKPADYDDLKAKAARLDELEQANKSEVEKATEKATAAERERDQARAEALRLRIATKHGIDGEDADLFLTGTDEATLTKQAERLAQRVADRKKQGNYAPLAGTSPSAGSSSPWASVLQGLDSQRQT